MRVRLRDEPDIEQRTRELVAAESRCCAFLDFELGRDAGDLVLDISGPEDARPVIDMFFALRPPEYVRRVRWPSGCDGVPAAVSNSPTRWRAPGATLK